MRDSLTQTSTRAPRLRQLLSAALLAWVVGSGNAAQRPEWAFFVPTDDSARLTMPKLPYSWRAPGSRRSYSRTQLQDVLDPPDWYPDEHPPMPSIVAHGSGPRGKGPPLLPCALCHLPNGAGHVESASLAGLPAEYIERQFVDWRSGARKIGVGDAQTIALLTAMKRSYSSEQVRAAAHYFASLQPPRWVRVIETRTVDIRGPAALGLSKRSSNRGLGRANASGGREAHSARYALHCRLPRDAASLRHPLPVLTPSTALILDHALVHAPPGMARAGSH